MSELSQAAPNGSGDGIATRISNPPLRQRLSWRLGCATCWIIVGFVCTFAWYGWFLHTGMFWLARIMPGGRIGGGWFQVLPITVFALWIPLLMLVHRSHRSLQITGIVVAGMLACFLASPVLIYLTAVAQGGFQGAR